MVTRSVILRGHTPSERSRHRAQRDGRCRRRSPRGFYSSFSELSDPDLARAIAAYWRACEWAELPDTPADLVPMIVALDAERSLRLDVAADVCEGNDVYCWLLGDLAERSGGAIRVTNPREDWASQPAMVIVSFTLNDQECRLSLMDCGKWVDPGVVTGLNELLSDASPRFLFVDGTDQTIVVTRATREERSVIEAGGVVRLLDEPPAQWMRVLPGTGPSPS